MTLAEADYSVASLNLGLRIRYDAKQKEYVLEQRAGDGTLTGRYETDELAQAVDYARTIAELY